MTLEDWELARADLKSALDLDPTDTRSSERLGEIEEAISDSKSRRELLMQKLAEERKTLPLPRYATRSREDMTIGEIKGTWCRTREAIKDQQISKEQTNEEGAVLAKWHSLINRESVVRGNAEVPKPWVKLQPDKSSPFCDPRSETDPCSQTQ